MQRTGDNLHCFYYYYVNMFYCFIILCKQILFKVHSLWGELWMFFMVWWKVSSGCTSVKVIVKGPLQQALAHILDRKCAMLRLMTLFFKESCVGVQKLHFDFSINHSFALWVGLTLNRILQPWGHNICLTLTIHIGYCTISTALSWYIPFLYFFIFFACTIDWSIVTKHILDWEWKA